MASAKRFPKYAMHIKTACLHKPSILILKNAILPRRITGFVSKFQKMTYENLVELGELTVNPMLDVFLTLLPESPPTDFGVF